MNSSDVTFRPSPSAADDRRRRILLIGICLVFGLCILNPSAALAIRLLPLTHLFDVDQGLASPSDVAVAPDGRIYVVDGLSHQVKVFDPQGRPLFALGAQGHGDGQLMHPLGIDVAPSGTVYVADSGNHRIQVFQADGSFVRAFSLPPLESKPADPTDLAVDEAADRAYIVDNDNHRILVYTLSDPKLLKTFGQAGSGERGFRYPFLITRDAEGYLYIVDVINTRVQVLNAEGLFVAFIGAWGVEKGQLYRPKGVASDRDGNVYVSDSYLGVVQVFKTNGDFYAAIGESAGGKVKKFASPVGLFVDHRKRLYVVEMLARKVSVYQLGAPAVEG